MNIHLRKPYKIVPFKHKRYDAHYHIPSAEVVVIPVRDFGVEVMCDIRWENGNGVLELKENAMFKSENLIALNPMIDENLFEIWTHYYGTPSMTVSTVKTEVS